MAGDQPQGARLPADDDRQGVPVVAAAAGRQGGVRRPGGEAGVGLDGVLRRAGVRQRRRQGPVQVHDAGAGRARRAAAQLRGVPQDAEVGTPSPSARRLP